MNAESQALLFAQEDDVRNEVVFADSQPVPALQWKILIVDDEPFVHRATKQTLERLCFDGRKLRFLSAYTRQEAEKLIRANPDVAVVLLDVMMAGEKAGLELAKYIREELGNTFVRIVLRTGQPEEAPEEQVIQEFDINDYKEKTELTASKLYTTMITALRSYRDIMTIENNRRGLEKILESSATLMEGQSISKLATGILKQLISILCLDHVNRNKELTGFVAIREPGKDLSIIAATDQHAARVGQPVHYAVKPGVSAEVQAVLRNRRSTYSAGRLIKYFCTKNGSESVIYLEGVCELREWERNLLDIFAINVSIAFDNLYLNKELEDTQKEILFTLGEFSETRSRETGNHVKRVAEYSKLLALKCGLPEEEAEIIRLASPMHDVGKLGIADAILNKPGKLTAEEFDVIKAHGTLGYEILRNSNQKIMQAAAIIAHQHHERFDGSGYPQGLAGENIHIYGRITAIADVFDALGSERVYKKAWNLADILDYFRRERDRHFDGRLVDLFLGNLTEFLAIRDAFIDA